MPVYGLGSTFGVLTEASPLFKERSQIVSTCYTKEHKKTTILLRLFSGYRTRCLVAINTHLAIQQTESLQNWGRIEELCLRRGLPLIAITTMSKNKTQNLSTLIPQIDRLLEIEVKCYLFHTLPGNRYNFIILKSIRKPVKCSRAPSEHLVIIMMFSRSNHIMIRNLQCSIPILLSNIFMISNIFMMFESLQR